MTDLSVDPKVFRAGIFITPHGFGHAARACAVIEGLRFYHPSTRFDIFTEVPEFFFEESLPDEVYTYFQEKTDIGVIHNPLSLEIDVDETLRRLKTFMPFSRTRIKELAELVKIRNLQFIVSDISPLGILVAEEAGIPAVLVENFTWDWIYEDYLETHPEFEEYIYSLKSILNRVLVHIQTEPAAKKKSCRIMVPPISRKVRTPREETRKSLEIGEDEKMILVTMGGIPAPHRFLDELHTMKGVRFVIPCSLDYAAKGNIIRLPYKSGYFHPDLIEASDAVVGKAGYSTTAEVYQSGVPFGYIPRSGFRETAVLETFIQEKMPGFAITQEDFKSGAWVDRLTELLSLPRVTRPRVMSGAVWAARYILHMPVFPY